MKLAVFSKPQELADWHNREADLIEANGLRLAKEMLARARKTGHDVKWHEGNVKSIERKVRKHRRLAQLALTEA